MSTSATTAPSAPSNDMKAPQIPPQPQTSTPFYITIPPVSAAEDDQLVSHLVSITNSIYIAAENGMWTDSYQRTNASETRSFLQAQKLALASISATSPLFPPTNIVGCIRISRTTRPPRGPHGGEILGNFGTLIAVPESRGSGLGRQLVQFAEDWARGWGAKKMQMELLVPTEFRHESKTWVQGWYERMGYEVVRVEDFVESYPELKPLLAVETELRVFEKGL